MNTWTQLNDMLRKTRTEEDALKLYETEKAGAARPTHLVRIWSRYNLLRNRRERKQIGKLVAKENKQGLQEAK